jgi:integrase
MSLADQSCRPVWPGARRAGLVQAEPERWRRAWRRAAAPLDRSPERSVLTLRQVATLAEVIGPRYRALILVAVFGSLWWGELAALRRCDIDLRTRTIRVERSLTELPGGGYHHGPPKSEAGKRRVAFPAHITAALKSHLADFVALEADALVCTSPTGPRCGMATSGAGSDCPHWPRLG